MIDRKTRSHRKTRSLATILGALAVTGLASLAFAAWTGVVQMPFQGSTADAPAVLAASYSTGSGIDFGSLTPLETSVPPASDAASWTFSYPANVYVKLTNPSGKTLAGFTGALRLIGTPDATLLANVHYRLTTAAGAPSSPGAPADFIRVHYLDASPDWVSSGTLASLVANGIDLSTTPFYGDTTCILRIVFWLDANAPQSVAGKSISGTLDLTTIQ